MGKRKGQLVDSESESQSGSQDESEETYVVEVVTKAKVVGNKEFDYLVRWYGYSPESDTWEPQENLEACTRLLKSFWKEVGKDHKKHPGPIGHEYSASDEWIKKERKHFRKELSRENAEKATDNEEKERKQKRKEAEKAKVVKSTVEDDAPSKSRLTKKPDILSLFSDISTGSDSDNTPLSALSGLKKKEKAPQHSSTAQGKVKASSSGVKIKLSIPKKPPIQLAQNSKGKFAGLKIQKKAPVPAQLASPVNSPIAATNDGPSSRPRTPLSAILTPTQSLSIGIREPLVPEPSDSFFPPRPPTSAPIAAPVELPRATDDDVDNFLTTVMPFGESEAQRPENIALGATNVSSAIAPTAIVPTATAPIANASTSISAGPRLAKKWSWSGDLFIDTAETAERLCEITISDSSETSNIGLRLGSILDSKDSIRLSKSYKHFELNSIFHALRKVDQIAKIMPREDRDKNPLHILMKYLSQRKLTISSSAITNFGHAAEMIIFPSTDKEFCKHFNIPLRYSVADCLLVILMPWHVPPSKYDSQYLRSDELGHSKFEEELEEIRKMPALLNMDRRIDMSLRVLGFEDWFIHFMLSRKYCIWSLQVDARPADRGRKFTEPRYDTKALFNVMNALKAENVGYDSSESRTVFIHVGAMRSLRQMPGIVERRCERPDVRFITYGTHESVNPSLWGFREVFPLGGIVTFTATALLENPLCVTDLIEQIHRHPHWECYILPSALAVFVRMSCLLEEDPDEVYKREPYRFGKILDMIDEGKLALMQSPGLYQGVLPGSEEAERDKWVTTQYMTVVKTPLQHIEGCWGTFVSEFSNKDEREIRASIELEIVKDLSRLQMQPAIRENYRRFVVIKALQDDIAYNKNGFEWRTAQEFEFGDKFSTSETTPQCQRAKSKTPN